MIYETINPDPKHTPYFIYAAMELARLGVSFRFIVVSGK